MNMWYKSNRSGKHSIWCARLIYSTLLMIFFFVSNFSPWVRTEAAYCTFTFAFCVGWCGFSCCFHSDESPSVCGSFAGACGGRRRQTQRRSHRRGQHPDPGRTPPRGLQWCLFYSHSLCLMCRHRLLFNRGCSVFLPDPEVPTSPTTEIIIMRKFTAHSSLVIGSLSGHFLFLSVGNFFTNPFILDERDKITWKKEVVLGISINNHRLNICTST